MNFNEYQKEAIKTAIYPKMKTHDDVTTAWLYPLLGLGGEVGEIEEKFKKILRDKGGVINKQDRDEILKEIGDAMWYLATLCTELGVDFNTVAKINIKKLKDRRKRNKIHGKGDNR